VSVLPVATSVTLTLFDATGRRVTTLLSGTLAAGIHSIPWHGVNAAGKAVPAGVYFYRLEAGRFRDTRKLLITW